MELLESAEPYLCLNMIVKNEGHIIKDTLTKLLNKVPAIDYWVISDTGSTDKTKEIISDFFKERNIKGELFDDDWKDFGHNRTLALEHAFGKSKYLCVFDADDEICGEFVLPDLKVDSYHLQFGDSNGTSYTRTQIINNKKKWKYVGVLHEIITCTEHTTGMDIIITGKYYTISGKSGSRSQDQNKYLKDALILEKAYEEAVKNNDELYNRYGFYCANSYYDCGKWGHAIKWYKITLDNKNWSQEKYVSCLRLYNCYSALNEKERGMFYLVKSFSYDKERVECLYELVAYYCSNDMNEVAYSYYNNVKSFYNERYLKDGLNDKLFLDVSKANLLLPYYMILVSDKVNDRDTTIQMYRIIFTKKHIERSKHYIGNMLYNLQFFIERVKDDKEFLRLFQEYVDFLISIDYPVYEHEFMSKYEKYGIKVANFSEQVFSFDDCLKSKNILLYSGYSPLKWNYTFSINNALGGSETAITCLTKNFPKDYTIYVAGDVEEETVENIRYVHFNNLKNLIKTTAFHTIIVSRYLNFYELYRNFSAYQTFIWGHDITLYAYGTDLSVEGILTKWASKITGCICQTEWHKNLFLSSFPQLKDKISTINNGINTDLFSNTKVKKVINRFIYTSCSERGLYKLVQLWPSILENLPDAELLISSYNIFPKSDEDIKILEIINKTPSIKHIGKLNRTELYNLMATAEYWLYPTNFNETSCITSLELLASEVICLYYPIAGLVNTVGDYGIKISEGNEIDTLLSLSIKKKNELKRKGKEYALSCSWENRAIEWSKLLFLHNDKNKLSQTEKRMFDLYESLSMPEAHTNILKKISETFTPNVIYDIGASTLHWTKEAKNIWPNSEFCAFDAIEEAEKLYKSKNIKYNIGVISDQDNKIVKFYENKENPAGNSYYKEIGHPNSVNVYPENSYIERKAMTLETIIKRNNFLLPDLVKIDVQGAELDILKGGQSIINKAKYLIIELQNVEYNRGAPLENVTIEYLQSNGWEIVESKFSNNGPDADYLFINTNYRVSDDNSETNTSENSVNNLFIRETEDQKSNEYQAKIWVFHPGYFSYRPVIQYLENLTDSKTKTFISNDINYINNINPHEITFLLNLFNIEPMAIDSIYKFNTKHISFLQLEPLNICYHLNKFVNFFNLHPYLKQCAIYDYSKSNIRILNKNGFTNCIYLPYKCTPDELNFLIKSNIKNKEYDFGYIYDWASVNPTKKEVSIGPPRRNKVIEFLIKNGFTVNLIAGYGEDRDSELGKCKIILNIHGQINENPNPSPDECSNIFEHIRCDRLLKAGYTILSETSYDLDQDFINKYSNLKIINHKDFFNLDVINNIIDEFNIKNIYDTLCLNQNPFDYYLNPVDIHEHLPTLYKYATECNSILECGVRASVSSWALAYGLINNNREQKKLILNDISPCDISNLLERTKNIKNLNISYQWINDLDITLNENVELTFVDTWHVGGHLKKELKKFSKLTNKYIIMHDTTVFEFTNEVIREKLSEEQLINLSASYGLSIEDIKMGLWPAIEDFLKNNPDWALHERYTNNNGLTILKKKPSKKIVDCFTFYNELELLKYRLTILNDYVDYFVLVEATHSFVGKEKPLFYQENKELFKEFNHKIIHIVVDDFSHKYPNINIENREQWNNEIFQRNCIKRGLDKLNLNDEDIFTVTDLDEIPDPKILEKIKKNEINIDVVTIELDFYYYNLNCKINGSWLLSKMISYKKYKELGFSCEQIRQNMSFKIIPKAGWHLSYFGDEKFIKNKIENFGHQEFNIADFTDENKISNRVKNKLDVYDRPNNSIVNVPIEDNDNLPPKYDIYLKRFYKTTIQNIETNTKKNIAFFIRHFTERGTEVSSYDYAHYNETLLDNKSYIIHFSDEAQKKYGFPNVKDTFEKFKSRFEMIEINDITDMNKVISKYKLDFFYTQTHGGNDIYQFENKTLWGDCKSIKHCVFYTMYPESDYYISISRHLNEKNNTNIPVIPHIIELPDSNNNLRNELNISNDAIVFGRHGGFNQFDLPISHEAIISFLDDTVNVNVYFLFMNTNKFYEHPRIIYLEKNIDLLYKTKFINTCDAMIHARSDGETFGLAIGEFSSKNKPIITCPCGDTEHIKILGNKAIIYENKEQLFNIFLNIREIIKQNDDWNAYKEYTPDKVMKKFMNIFMPEINNSYANVTFDNINYIDMNSKAPHFNNTKELVIVSAFLDINREKWSTGYKRTAQDYILSFTNYFNYNTKMLVFIDDKYIDEIKEIYNNSSYNNTIFVPINNDWMTKHIYAWQLLDISKHIMQSDKYKNLVKDRIVCGNPENIYADYNAINHSKIDFICYAINNNLINRDTFICWSDFGYFNSILHNNPSEYPVNHLDITKFNPNKLTFCLRNKLDNKDKDTIYTLVNAPEKITGSFFAGSATLMIKLQELYHISLKELYNNNISDDDQHIYLRCFLKEPNLFNLYLDSCQWPKGLCYFEKLPDRFELVKTLLANIKNGKFVEIGCDRGTFSKYILTVNKTSTLYSVDPYISYANYIDSINYVTGDNLYNETNTNLTQEFGDRFKLIREFSNKACNLIPNNLNFVYIDGNHKYEYVYEDLCLWWEKLAPNGIIVGDDAVDTDETKRDKNGNIFIEWCPGSYGEYGVIHAFNRFISEKKCYGQIIGNQFVLFK